VKLHGLQITVITTAKTNEQALDLLKALGFPFQEKKAATAAAAAVATTAKK